MKKIIAIISICLLLAACGASSSEPASTVSSSIAESSSVALQSSNVEGSSSEIDTQTVKVSDFMAALESFGVEPPEGEEVDDGIWYMSDFASVGECMFNYSLVGYENDDFYSAVFYIEGNDSEEILAFCAAFVFEGEDKDAASNFVIENRNTEGNAASGPRKAEITISDIDLIIEVDGESTTLYIAPH